jgi:SAM-dependent methyltransferase
VTTPTGNFGLYDDPRIYDLLYTPGTAAEVTALERLARRHVPHPARDWLEPACGTGRYLRVLAARGYRVTGYDLQPHMLAYARQRLTTIRRHLTSARRPASVRLLRAAMQQRLPLPARSIDVAFNLVNTIRHLENDATMLRHLREIARLLRPGGVYAIGISLTDYAGETADEDVWIARRGACRVRQVVQYLPPGTAPRSRAGARTELVISHLSIERPSGVTYRDCTYPLRCYDTEQWHTLLARSPLQHIAIADAAGRQLVTRRGPYAIDLLQRER